MIMYLVLSNGTMVRISWLLRKLKLKGPDIVVDILRNNTTVFNYMFQQILCFLQFELQSTELNIIYSVRKMQIKYKNKLKGKKMTV